MRIETLLSIPPCSGGVALKRLLKEIEASYVEQVEVAFHTARAPLRQTVQVGDSRASSRRRPLLPLKWSFSGRSEPASVVRSAIPS